MSLGVRRILIPLASAGGGQGRIALIRADGVQPANDAKLIAGIALLNDCRLYRAGEAAAAAVRELGIGSDKIITRLGLHGRAYLSAVNAPDFRALSPNNSASAELGLALAMLMYEGQSEAAAAIATGELATDESLHLAQDVPVKPVGSMGEKIETVRTYLEDHRGAAMPRHFFFPAATPEGEETLSAHKAGFERLQAAYRSHGVELSLHPITHLREALSVLKIKGPGLDPFYRKIFKHALRAAAVLAIIAVAAAAFLSWLARPIQLDFADILLSSGKTVPSPFPAASKEDGISETAAACTDPAGRTVYPASAAIVFRAKIRNPPSWTDSIAPYHFALLTVSSKSGVKVFSPSLWQGAGGDRELSLSVSLTEAGESNKLIILARRFAAFDTARLRDRLSEIADKASPSDRINAVTNTAVAEAPGYLDYLFLTQKGPLTCSQHDTPRG